jgi:N-methylhydantoinase B/oxoprolinase/acetone carboxylase alpha subunit
LNTYVTNEGVEKNVGGKNTFDLKAGEIIRIESPGGGGYGKAE